MKSVKMHLTGLKPKCQHSCVLLQTLRESRVPFLCYFPDAQCSWGTVLLHCQDQQFITPSSLGYQVCCSRSLVSLSTAEVFVDAMKVRWQIWESKAGWSAVTHLSAPSRLHVRDQYSITVRSKTLVPLMFILCLPREFSSCKMSGSRSTGCRKETILRWCQMQSSELWAVIQLISTFKKTVPTICRPGLDSLFRWGNGVRSQHALQSRHQISPMA